MNASELDALRQAQAQVLAICRDTQRVSNPTAPNPIDAAKLILNKLPEQGIGLAEACRHLFEDVVPGLSGSSTSPNYYGFVTGGVTPAALIADNIVTFFDQNVQVHLPEDSVATVVEHQALMLLLQLLDVSSAAWPARAFTTGATAGNILGLACARDAVLDRALARLSLPAVAGEGVLERCMRAGVHKIQLLTTMPHSSLGKAASLVGLGRNSIIDVSKQDHHLHLDIEKLERHLAEKGTVSIVAISCGEVNTGHYATSSEAELARVRELCDKHAAWIHVDGAFGYFARVLPDEPKYQHVRRGTEGIDRHADSIAGDLHKLLNVPYDCGFFICRHLKDAKSVIGNGSAPYLSAGGDATLTTIESPLNLHLENSARFRALPVYATLLAYGKDGHSRMVARMVDLARCVAAHIRDECSSLELLPADVTGRVIDPLEQIFICVLFRAHSDESTRRLLAALHRLGKIVCTQTSWNGRPAIRMAVAKWNTDVARDLPIIKSALQDAWSAAIAE